MYFKNECLLLNGTIQRLEARVQEQALEITQLKAALPKGNANPLNNTELTVIVSGLPAYPGEDPLLVAENIVEHLGADQNNVPVKSQVKVLAAARLPNRNLSRPPLLKVRFKSLKEKKLVLTYKKNLHQSPLKHIYLRSSKSHEERLLEFNMRTILENCPWGKHFRIAGSGRLLPKTRDSNIRQSSQVSTVPSMEFRPRPNYRTTNSYLGTHSADAHAMGNTGKVYSMSHNQQSTADVYAMGTTDQDYSMSHNQQSAIVSNPLSVAISANQSAVCCCLRKPGQRVLG